jgi:hypothetical protein
MHQGIEAGNLHIGMLGEIRSSAKERAGITAFSGAERKVVPDRVHAAGRDIGILAQIPTGIEEGGVRNQTRAGS